MDGTENNAAGTDKNSETEKFVRLADRFIRVANTANSKLLATDIHMAFLYGAARYNAFVAKNVIDVADHEAFVTEMAAAYTEMLRNHLADPSV
jgi:ATP-dependent helicase/DNAse subunit B